MLLLDLILLSQLYIAQSTGLQKVDGRNRKQWKRVYVEVNDWNNRGNVEIWRQSWSDITNRYMERNNVHERIDHRSYQRQGIDKIPTIHMGVSASQMEERGITTERGNINRAIVSINQKLRQFWNEIVQLKDKLKEVIAQTTHPSFISVLQSIVEGGDLHQRYGKVRSLSMATNVLDFMREHNISKMSELREKVSELIRRSGSIREQIKVYDVQKNADLLLRELQQSPQRDIRARDFER